MALFVYIQVRVKYGFFVGAWKQTQGDRRWSRTAFRPSEVCGTSTVCEICSQSIDFQGRTEGERVVFWKPGLIQKEVRPAS